MGAGLMSLKSTTALLKKMTDSHGQAFSHPDSRSKMFAPFYCCVVPPVDPCPPLPPSSSPKFISDFQLDLSEVLQPLDSFQTFNDFFTRRVLLKQIVFNLSLVILFENNLV